MNDGARAMMAALSSGGRFAVPYVGGAASGNPDVASLGLGYRSTPNTGIDAPLPQPSAPIPQPPQPSPPGPSIQQIIASLGGGLRGAPPAFLRPQMKADLTQLRPRIPLSAAPMVQPPQLQGDDWQGVKIAAPAAEPTGSSDGGYTLAKCAPPSSAIGRLHAAIRERRNA